MRNILIAESPDLLRWVESKLKDSGIKANFRDNSAVCAVDDGRQILGAVVFHDWNGTNIQLSIVTTSPRWAGKEFIRHCFDVAFGCFKATHITTYVREDNKKSLDLVKKLGFKEEGRLRESVVDLEGNVYDGILFGMLKNECRWL